MSSLSQDVPASTRPRRDIRMLGEAFAIPLVCLAGTAVDVQAVGAMPTRQDFKVIRYDEVYGSPRRDRVDRGMHQSWVVVESFAPAPI